MWRGTNFPFFWLLPADLREFVYLSRSQFVSFLRSNHGFHSWWTKRKLLSWIIQTNSSTSTNKNYIGGLFEISLCCAGWITKKTTILFIFYLKIRLRLWIFNLDVSFNRFVVGEKFGNFFLLKLTRTIYNVCYIKLKLPFREACECQKCSFFFNIVQTASDPPPRFEHVCCKFFWTTFKKVRKCLARPKFGKIMRKSVGKCQTYPKI